MLIIPAIDIKKSKVVRLLKGDFSKQTVYSDDPLGTALSLDSCRIKRIHIVDLDAASGGDFSNRELIKNIAAKLNCEVEVGGGIRKEEIIAEYLNSGVKYLVVGTKAYTDPAWFKSMLKQYSENIILGLDVCGKKIKIQGWQQDSGVSVRDAIFDFSAHGLRRVVYTDISRDGTMKGIDTELLSEFLKMVDNLNLKITVSGGVKDKKDINAVLGIKNPKIEGLIIGKAFYEGSISMEYLRRVNEQKNSF
ncbi:MAG: 1-(5-phosphoribosyl)-5-[(5-phosphoribosylamino)methylideneamino]imidazole-4-carboxamide isomerase [Candidatus Omnitrophica bacterium]|nr:1-(5-phosphoribosyl)-5-[(5-phosphoribosylamino)methylideneamino]imidazole-4-carboxamide isomerase [Candidatus Omnitrophota bacterium]